MADIKLPEEQIKAEYKNADAAGKALLEKLYGKATFVNPLAICEKIKTWADILAANNETQEQFDKRTEHDSEDEIGNKQWKLLAKALNEEWIADFANGKQEKWWPWHDWIVSKACFVFAYSHCDFTYSYAGCGPRLCFRSKAICNYACEQFPEIFNRALKHY